MPQVTIDNTAKAAYVVYAPPGQGASWVRTLLPAVRRPWVAAGLRPHVQRAAVLIYPSAATTPPTHPPIHPLALCAQVGTDVPQTVYQKILAAGELGLGGLMVGAWADGRQWWMGAVQGLNRWLEAFGFLFSKHVLCWTGRHDLPPVRTCKTVLAGVHLHLPLPACTLKYCSC